MGLGVMQVGRGVVPSSCLTVHLTSEVAEAEWTPSPCPAWAWGLDRPAVGWGLSRSRPSQSLDSEVPEPPCWLGPPWCPPHPSTLGPGVLCLPAICSLGLVPLPVPST